MTHVILPRKLTAENGAKTLLSGEFSESVGVVNEDGDEHNDEVPVRWTNIKRIYDMVVAYFACPLPTDPLFPLLVIGREYDSTDPFLGGPFMLVEANVDRETVIMRDRFDRSFECLARELKWRE